MTRERLLRLTAWGERQGEGSYDSHHVVVVRHVVHDAMDNRDYLIVDQDTERGGRAMSAVITARDRNRWRWPAGDEVRYVDLWDVTGDERYAGEDGRGFVPPRWTSSLYVVHDDGARPREPGALARLSARAVDHVLIRVDAFRRMKP